MIEQTIRKSYQKCLVDPLAARLLQYISPNFVTVLSGILGVLVLPVLYYGYVMFAVVLLLLSGYSDTLDGTLARMTKHSTVWGTVLDIMMDRFVELAVVFALWSVDPSQRCEELLNTWLVVPWGEVFKRSCNQLWVALEVHIALR